MGRVDSNQPAVLGVIAENTAILTVCYTQTTLIAVQCHCMGNVKRIRQAWKEKKTSDQWTQFCSLSWTNQKSEINHNTHDSQRKEDKKNDN